MRDYELTFIVRAQLEDEALTALVDRVQGWVTADNHGKVVRRDLWGRRRLAYPINKEREGLYIFMLIQAEPAQIAAVERNLRITEEIMRFLFVQIEPEVPAEPAPAGTPAAG